MRCKPEEIAEKWSQAQLNPIEPRLIESGSVHEEVHVGDRLLEHGGLEEFPIPISTPGLDNAPYFSAGCCVSKDPETGIRNVGVYRGMVKSKTRVGICAGEARHLFMHRQKSKARGASMPAALVVGAIPNIGYCAVSPIPYSIEEYAIAGGIAGEPVELVKCKTIDLEVPATAEIVIEGEIPTDYLEREAPFGEYTGYMGEESIRPYFNVTCITHRKNPIYSAFISQFPPSESSKLRQIATEANFHKFLKRDCGISGIVDVAFHEESGSDKWLAISMKKSHSAQPWQALNAAIARDPVVGKVVIVVDDDIDPRDPDSVIWAICFRMQPHRDMRITQGKRIGLDHSAIAPGLEYKGLQRKGPQLEAASSAMLIDATRKWDYPPVSLPKREFMERARKIWEEEGLPTLNPKMPWYGYSLGYWTEENEAEAELALKGEHYQTGEKLAQSRLQI